MIVLPWHPIACAWCVSFQLTVSYLVTEVVFFREITTIPDKSLGTLSHFLQHLSRKCISSSPTRHSMLFIVINSSLLVSNIVWGEGVPILVMSLLIVCKIACQRIFMLSDSGIVDRNLYKYFLWLCFFPLKTVTRSVLSGENSLKNSSHKISAQWGKFP